jgi:hypothetical protein
MKPLTPCGTTTAYRRHLRHGEKPCAECRWAEAKYKQATRPSRAKNPKEPPPMTTPPPPPVDTGNILLAVTPAHLTLSPVEIPAEGQRIAFTIRTQSATVTVFLTKQDADNWAAVIKQHADALSGSGLIIAGPGMQLNGQNQPEASQ